MFIRATWRMPDAEVEAITQDGRQHSCRIIDTDPTYYSAFVKLLSGSGNRQLSPRQPCDDAFAEFSSHLYPEASFFVRSPFGQVGSQFWLREPWRTSAVFDRLSPSQLPIQSQIIYQDSRISPTEAGKHRSALAMPCWAARYRIEITKLTIIKLSQLTQEQADEIAVPPHLELADPWVWLAGFKRFKTQQSEQSVISECA